MSLDRGDTVLVEISGTRYPLIIDEVKNRIVIAENYRVGVINNEWKVYDYPTLNKVLFAKTSPQREGFTDIYDINYMILMNADPE